MCTVLKYKNAMGRNFDYEQSYKEQIIRVEANEFNNEYDIIGMATGFEQDYPLMYDGMNSQGLCVAGLAFEGNARYQRYQEDKMNVPAFDVVFYILGHCKNCEEVEELAQNLNIWCEPYSDDFPNSDLHWFICDRERSLVLEQTEYGLHCFYSNGVMTNNPPYVEMKMQYEYNKRFYGGEGIEFGDMKWYSRGLDTNGIPGSYLSEDRFERVSYLKEKLENVDTNLDTNASAFHLLGAAEQIYGATSVDDKYEYTIYSIVYDMETLKVHIKTYDNLQFALFSLNDTSLKRFTI
jgi:choloylglycine hydrolase